MMRTLILLLSAALIMLFNVCTAEKYGVNVNIGNDLQCWLYNSNQGEIRGYGKKDKCISEVAVTGRNSGGNVGPAGCCIKEFTPGDPNGLSHELKRYCGRPGECPSYDTCDANRCYCTGFLCNTASGRHGASSTTLAIMSICAFLLLALVRK